MIKPVYYPRTLALLLLSIFSFVYLISCNTLEKNELQNDVLKDIYKDIVLNIPDYRITPFPNPKQMDSIKNNREIQAKKTKDNRPMLVIVNDSIKNPDFVKNLNNDSSTNKKLFHHEVFFKNNSDIVLINELKYKEQENKLLVENFLSGKLFISNVKFDKTLKKGTLTVSYDCGKLCGEVNKIFVELINNKWVIVNTKILSVS